MRPKRLGRGLETLLTRTEPAAAFPAVAVLAPPEVGGNGDHSPGGSVQHIPVASIRANPFQPRTSFPEDSLEELRASIQAHGVLQPIVVRPMGTGYEILAGERRLRAVRALGLERIPALVRPASDEEMQTLALVENLQREDLNAMEKARGLKAMMRNFGLTQEDVAERVGKARATVANLLRLLDLPGDIQAMVEDGRLSGAHARAILQAQGAERRLQLARLAVERGWSVRETERRAQGGPTVGRRRSRPEDPYLRDLEDRLRKALSTEVRLQARGKGGKVEIRYHDADDLDRLLDLLKA